MFRFRLSLSLLLALLHQSFASLYFPLAAHRSLAQHRSLTPLTLLLPLLHIPHLVLADGLNGEECGALASNAACSLTTCCSASGFCGTTAAYCGSGCQSSFGSCVVPTTPSCVGSQQSATNGRRVGYYQVAQASTRACDAVAPAQINATGLTHLVLAFASFDSVTFAVAPANEQDATFYRPFTALQGPALETWISIGGGAFPYSSWNAMASTSANRATFVSSLLAFMQNYGFQGVDLDFEFPAASGADSQHLVALASDLRAALGTAYGISMTLPADWGSLRGFDPAGLAASVDFFNYMGYDIRGWGVDGQPSVSWPADIRDIAGDMVPLWANGTDPGMVNLGVPYYGRGYTLGSSACAAVGCAATGPSAPGDCTQDATGILSLAEIQALPGANVTLDAQAMQKQAVWGEQWVGFDDADTVALKLGWADERCLGGGVFWSVDLE